MHAAFYRRGREASTISTYNSEYRRLVEFYRRFRRLVCVFEERDMISYVIWRFKQGVTGTQLMQVMAVINMIFEVCGFESPSKSPLVAKVKMTIIKEANEGKRKMERIGMTKKTLKKIMKAFYKEDFEEVEPERRRFLLMKVFCFLGVKHFNDIQKLKRKNVFYLGG